MIPNWGKADGVQPLSSQRFGSFLPSFPCQALVAVLLSVQTRDAVALAAMRQLMGLRGRLCVATAVAADVEEVEACISTCNFYRSKAKYIKGAGRRALVDWLGP